MIVLEGIFPNILTNGQQAGTPLEMCLKMLVKGLKLPELYLKKHLKLGSEYSCYQERMQASKLMGSWYSHAFWQRFQKYVSARLSWYLLNYVNIWRRNQPIKYVFLFGTNTVGESVSSCTFVPCCFQRVDLYITN